MLTREGYRVRKWGHLPALSKLIENEPIPDRYFGIASTCDNLFNRLPRTAEIVLIVKEHEDRILTKREPKDLAQLCEEVEGLCHELLGAAAFFREHADRMQRLQGQLREQLYRQQEEEKKRPPQ